MGLGIELNQRAVKDAKENARRNNMKNIHFVAADATEYMTYMSQKGQRADVVVLDPPRGGSTKAFVHAVAAVSPKRVIYISCNPETLARDLGWFQKKGYQAEGAVGMDMFPWVGHVEVVCCLQRRKS